MGTHTRVLKLGLPGGKMYYLKGQALYEYDRSARKSRLVKSGLKFKRDSGYLYFIKDGDLYRVARKQR